MKIFISYKFANEDVEELNKFMNNVTSTLKKAGHTPLTTFYEEKNKKTAPNLRKIMDKALGYIDKSDKIIIIVKAPDTSLGMNFETGYAVAKNKKIILAIQENLSTRWIEHYANKIIKFSDLNELYQKLEKLI